VLMVVVVVVGVVVVVMMVVVVAGCDCHHVTVVKCDFGSRHMLRASALPACRPMLVKVTLGKLIQRTNSTELRRGAFVPQIPMCCTNTRVFHKKHPPAKTLPCAHVFFFLSIIYYRVRFLHAHAGGCNLLRRVLRSMASVSLIHCCPAIDGALLG